MSNFIPMQEKWANIYGTVSNFLEAAEDGTISNNQSVTNLKKDLKYWTEVMRKSQELSKNAEEKFRLSMTESNHTVMRKIHAAERVTFYNLLASRERARNAGIVGKALIEKWSKCSLGNPNGTKKSGMPMESRGVNLWSETHNFHFAANINFDDRMSAELKNEVAYQLAAWSGKDIHWASKKISSYKSPVWAQAIYGAPLTRDEFIVNLFRENMIEHGYYLVIDLETTGIDPILGDIIQIGLQKIDAVTGKVIERIEENFDLSVKNMGSLIGTGPENIHRINHDEINGLKPFRHPEIQEKYFKLICDPDVIAVAHNWSFEQEWLSEHLDGFWNFFDRNSETTEAAGEPIILSLDTRMLSSFLQETSNNKLSSFTTANGVEYSPDAHKAIVDVEMTSKALINFKNKFAVTEVGKRPKNDFQE